MVGNVNGPREALRAQTCDTSGARLLFLVSDNDLKYNATPPLKVRRKEGKKFVSEIALTHLSRSEAINDIPYPQTAIATTA